MRKNNKRQYLLGDLQLPQDLDFIKDKEIEVGLSKYNKYTVEIPHFHTVCTEYQYVLEGKTKYLDIDTNIEYEVKKGDFYVVRPNTKYFQKSEKGTTILFFKNPGLNDKKIVEFCDLTEEQIKWSEKYNV